MPTKKEIRQNDIYQILLNKGQVSIKDLSASLHVTPETIRNDLNEMEKMHRAGRHHGYATSLSGINEVPLQIRERENLADKRKVGVRALQEVKDNQVLFVDAGSTYILGLPALSARKNLTIVTNGISVAYQAGLMNIDTIVLGGRLSNVGLRTYGPEVMEALRAMIFDQAFLGTDGFHRGKGFTALNADEIVMKRQIIANADRTVVATDVSKFEKDASYIICGFHEVDALVTNPLTDNQRAMMKEISKIIEV